MESEKAHNAAVARHSILVYTGTIHEAIDLYEAAKEYCTSSPDLSEAQVLLLDFAKAYDSLNREFLLAVLQAKGFPPKFCQIVQAIHTNTTVQFMANGEISRRLQVTSGIRQGCPLAPLLFILAVDLLYDEIEGRQDIRGIELDETRPHKNLKVAGYADDAAIYIADMVLQQAVIDAVARFSNVSGLSLNLKKSAAIRLGSRIRLESDTQATNRHEAKRRSLLHAI
ncbi:LOW QUALITY PROTEIN: polyprotein [Phytophthora megakarya]|uniref:Polyprotein n=1 Tax=Phytophthora megakarya TaxID=4795 RepID=A0A225W2F5_9STRA|nr:LOW QUALITY PROTEIN: polyprotein [Phytophthora megakarya]